ncbi:MAG: hypothetical protein IKK20_01825 [Clostridia bacterium]|nr:hypothetical protein [Clostridia bacterium]MBR2433153.1 hypothetical protein [Clostridia bacterium]MBR3790524.1 hypothetical protein [Clostridia bacterium]
MAKMNKFKRLCADTNVVIGLALLYEKGERAFINTNIAGRNTRQTLKQYAEDIATLQHYIDKGVVQLVIPPQVMFELRFREKTIDENGNNVELSPETVAREKLKDLTLEYLQKMPTIKVARILPQRKIIFEQFTQRLADEYVNTYRIFERNKMGKTPSDAIIMAQVSALGIDFLSRDQHFHHKHYLAKCSKAEKISIANKNLGGRSTKVIAIDDLESVLHHKTEHGVALQKTFKDNQPIAQCAYMNYDEYLQDKALERQNHMEWLRKYTETPKEL